MQHRGAFKNRNSVAVAQYGTAVPPHSYFSTILLVRLSAIGCGCSGSGRKKVEVRRSPPLWTPQVEGDYDTRPWWILQCYRMV